MTPNMVRFMRTKVSTPSSAYTSKYYFEETGLRHAYADLDRVTENGHRAVSEIVILLTTNLCPS